MKLSATLLCLIAASAVAQKSHVEKVQDLKEFKKLLRTKTNVLVLFSDGGGNQKLRNVEKTIDAVSVDVFGKGTLAVVDCSDAEGKKICKKYKASPDPYELHHFSNGEFHKQYDRKLTAHSMTAFMEDPKGEAPWSEDESASDVHHLDSPKDFERLLKKSKLPILVMFYAPWCGHCKRMKPEYAAAATELQGVGVLAAMDLDKNENKPVGAALKINGFPSLKYFKDGQMLFDYPAGRTKADIIAWMKDPKAEVEAEPIDEEKPWSETSTDVAHLTTSTFDGFVTEHQSVLVMFYAPWCGHCKSMKPAYEAAAAQLRASHPTSRLAAVDATKETDLASRFDVSGYPTVKYFQDGEFKFNFDKRTEAEIVEFMKNPQEPPPPPPPEKPWSEQESAVRHLTDDNFKASVKAKKHALVMFYAPWCGHCKAAKPAYTEAAEFFGKEPKVLYAAVDCTLETKTCEEFDVKGFPTIKAFKYGKAPKDYSGSRDKEGFVDFMLRELGPDYRPDNLPAQQSTPPPKQQWSHVNMIADKDFESALGQPEKAMVMFIAPWCGHCKKAKPEFEAAAVQAPEFYWGAVDCTVEKDLCKRYDVKGYPTILTFVRGKTHEKYTGGRTAAQFVNALRKLPSPEKTEL